MLLMNEENTKTISEKTVTVPVPEEMSQEEVIRELEEANKELAHQLADTRYKLNQAEIDYKGLQKTVDKSIQARNWWRADYYDLIDKILDRVNRGRSDD